LSGVHLGSRRQTPEPGPWSHWRIGHVDRELKNYGMYNSFGGMELPDLNTQWRQC
jgi:hypothetical protein